MCVCVCVLCSYHVTVSVQATNTKNALHKERSHLSRESRTEREREREYLCIPARAVTRERERERESTYHLCWLLAEREREREEAMTSVRTDDGLRFRFRATSLPKSPSAERFVMSRREQHCDDDAQINEDDDDNDENVVLATYVEPPELPTKTTHKVFGALFISLLSFLSDETRLLLPTYIRVACIYIYITYLM